MQKNGKYFILGAIILIFILGINFINNGELISLDYFTQLIIDRYIIEDENSTISNESKTTKKESTNSKIPNSSTLKTTTKKKSNNHSNSNNDTSKKENIVTTSKAKKIIDATKEYYCLGDSKLEGDKCLMTFTLEPVVKTYYCEEGELLSPSSSLCDLGGKKYFTPSNIYGDNNTEEIFKQNCRGDGGFYELDIDTWKCYKYVTEYADAIPKEYSCLVDGYELVDGKCVSITAITALYKYTCPEGYILNVMSCIEK